MNRELTTSDGSSSSSTEEILSEQPGKSEASSEEKIIGEKSSSDSESSSSSSSTEAEKEEDKPDILKNINIDKPGVTSTTPSPTYENREHENKRSGSEREISYSESGSSKRESIHEEDSSVVTESEFSLLQSILSDSSSEKILTDIDVTSPKEGKFSSSTDEELLRKFRQQQANRRYRPRSAKVRHNVEPEPEIVLKVNKENKANSSGESSSSSAEGTGNHSKKKRPRRSRKRSSSTGSESDTSVRSQEKAAHRLLEEVSTSSTQSDVEEIENKTKKKTNSKKSSSKSGSVSSTSETLTTSVTSASPDTLTADERPPSRQEKRPTSYNPRRQIKKEKSGRYSDKPSVHQLLRDKSTPISKLQEKKYQKAGEPGFPWPYNEDCVGGERELRRLINFHKEKLNRFLAQEYLQRHLEVNLQKVGAHFKQYEREPRPLSRSQIKQLREQDVTWVYLDGRLYNLDEEGMGQLNEKQRGRRKNKIDPRKDQVSATKPSTSRDRSGKRSVSFDAASDRRGSATRKVRSLSRSSSRGSRDESVSRKKKVVRAKSRSSSRGSKARSRDSSSSKRSSTGSKVRFLSSNQEAIQENRKNVRPMTAKPSSRRVRSSSSSSASSSRSASKEKSKKKHRSQSKEKWYSKLGFGGKKDKSKERKHQKEIKSEGSIERVVIRGGKKDKKRNTVRIAIAPGIYNTKHPTVFTDTNPCLGRRDDVRALSRRPKDDYNFYKSPNIPGHAFPYYYLSYLLSMDNNTHGNTRGRQRTNRVILTPAPVHRTTKTKWGSQSLKSNNTPTKSRTKNKSPKSSPKRQRKTKSVIYLEEEKRQRSTSQESRNSTRNMTSSSVTYPRITPGSGPIKCSWKEKPEETPHQFPVSDHQLKNTDNPVIRDWLRRKDAQLRVRRQNEVRKQRRKTERLIDEQNDKEDKHERALRQYETWKQEKDREILLRRRNETRDANSAAIIKTRRKERPRTAPPVSMKNTTFAELRSSSASPAIAEKPPSKKPRPKSANTLGVSFSNPVSTSNARPRSATPPRKEEERSNKPQSVFSKTENFFKSFLGVGGSSKTIDTETQLKDEHATEKVNGVVVPEKRESYEKWVRSSNGKVGPENSKPPRKPPARRNKRPSTGQKLPPHNHDDNDLISSLAKRRIESILANRKRVDSGLPRRPRSGANDEKKAGNRVTSSGQRKWKLREDNVIENSRVPNQQKVTKGRSVNSSDDERPKFSFSKKSGSKAGRHERNPALRQSSDIG